METSNIAGLWNDDVILALMNRPKSINFGLGHYFYNIFYNFVLLSLMDSLSGHIFDESVLAFILEWKSGKFSMLQGEQHTRHSVLLCLGCSAPYSIRVWGIVYL